MTVDKIKREAAGCWRTAIISTIIWAMGKRVSSSFPAQLEVGDVCCAQISLSLTILKWKSFLLEIFTISQMGD